MKRRLGPANMRPIARRRRGQRIFAELSFLAMRAFAFGDLGISQSDAESVILTGLVADGVRLVRLDGRLATESDARLDTPDPYLATLQSGVRGGRK